MSNPVEEPDKPNSGIGNILKKFTKYEVITFSEHDFMRDAVKIIQIEAIADLKQTIKELTEENDEKEKLVEKIRKEKVDEIKRIREEFERKIRAKFKE